MPSFKTSAVVSALAGAASVMAHGHVNFFKVDGKEYAGYDVTKLPYMASPPQVYGWSATNTDNGFVDPTLYSSPDIICHKGAKNAALTATVAAGSKIQFFWDTWPLSHKGPIIDYLAPCGDDCATVDKAGLEFFKIQQVGLIDTSEQNGKWASDELIAANNSWTVTVPETVKPGKYVLRHEIIALHSAGQQNGAQNYPQCFNIEVTGSGTEQPAGTLGTKLYTASDAGILVSIYNNLKSYAIPGPALSFGSGSGSGSTPAAPSAAPSAPAASAPAASAPAATPAAPAATTTAAAEAAATTAPAAAQPTSGSGSGSKPSCQEKRRRRLARKVARQHARDVVRSN